MSLRLVGGAPSVEGVVQGWGRRRSSVERTNRQTGMHRPWGDFCVYRSALTPGAGSESMACSAPRNEGFFGSLSPFPFLLSHGVPPFIPSYSRFRPARDASNSRQKLVVSTPLSFIPKSRLRSVNNVSRNIRFLFSPKTL